MLSSIEKKWFSRWLRRAPSRWFGQSSTVIENITGGSHGLSYLRHLVRGNRIRRSESLTDLNDKAVPILLIHGFLGTRGSMYVLERRLLDDGFCVFSFNLGTLNTRDIRRSAFLIHRKVERILAQTSSLKVNILAHSMGGLIGLYYIKKLGGHERVGRMVTMGTPYRGTWTAIFGIALLGLHSTSSWQLLPHSRLLDELHNTPIPDGVEIVSVAAARDRLCPPTATRIPGVRSITVPFGHSSLVVSASVYKRLKSLLHPGQYPDEDEPVPLNPIRAAGHLTEP